MKKFKKIIALLLALTLCLGMGVTAFAAEANDTFAAFDALSAAQQQADALKAIGLFQGSDKGYELERVPTRLEALIMLIRLSGKENDALYPWEEIPAVPFTDMPTWEGAADYINYAYANGLIDGTGDTTFEPDAPASAQMFISFALRALGYTVEESWENWDTLGKEVGIITDVINLTSFTRADCVLVSGLTLNTVPKGGELSLLNDMNQNGLIGELPYRVYKYLTLGNITAESALIDIFGKLYANLEDAPNLNAFMPMAFDNESAEYIIGTSELDIVEAFVCEPMMTSVAHSVSLIRVAEGSDIEAAKTAIRENVNPNKWICVGVDPANIYVENIGNLILLVMDDFNGKAIADNFLELAQ